MLWLINLIAEKMLLDIFLYCLTRHLCCFVIRHFFLACRTPSCLGGRNCCGLTFGCVSSRSVRGTVVQTIILPCQVAVTNTSELNKEKVLEKVTERQRNILHKHHTGGSKGKRDKVRSREESLRESLVKPLFRKRRYTVESGFDVCP